MLVRPVLETQITNNSATTFSTYCHQGHVTVISRFLDMCEECFQLYRVFISVDRYRFTKKKHAKKWTMLLRV
jgi:hypothetical protein